MELSQQDRVTSIKNRDLADVCFENEKSNRNRAVFEKLCSVLNLPECNDTQRTKLMSISRLFHLKFNEKLEKVARNRQNFAIHNKDWLQAEVVLPEGIQSTPAVVPEPSRPRGRPQKSFEEASIKTKKRRASMLATNRSTEELQLAAQISGGTFTADQSGSLSPHEALALYIDLDLSERKYNVLRDAVNRIHKDLFPSLYALNAAKNSLLPSEIYVDETSAVVNLQQLMYQTAKSIINIANVEHNSELKLICKWGFDGSSGHSQYKQKFSDDSSTDEFLFLVAMVPLKLVIVGTGREVWVNPRPSSTHYCRPIKFMFKKENAELVRNEEIEMKTKISQLEPCSIETENGQRHLVSCDMLFTMLDGSVSNILSETNATARCTICGAGPKDMNTQAVLARVPNVENYRFGLSTLHCWIRFFELLLHIGYKLPVKAWRITGSENKENVETNKKRIQAEFKSKMGLIVDKPKPGYGSSNDGNTARRFFSNADLSSEITGVEKDLIVKFSIILRVLASGRSIRVNEFKLLLDETRMLYIRLYGWHYMSPTVHKVLVHGCDIIASFPLPIGQLSEDALEARHKEVRKNRLSHTRKYSRVSSNTDLMKILLLTSEPLISFQRRVITRKNVRVDGEVQKYLNQEQENTSSDEVDENSNDVD